MRLNRLAVVLAALALAGCESLLTVSGSAYEWRDAPPDAQSHVIVGGDLPEGVSLTPVGGVAVAVGSDGSRPVLQTVSVPSGAFSDAEVVSYLDGAYTLTATLDGYAPAQGTLLFGTEQVAVPDTITSPAARKQYRDGHYFVTHVILVRRVATRPPSR